MVQCLVYGVRRIDLFLNKNYCGLMKLKNHYSRPGVHKLFVKCRKINILGLIVWIWFSSKQLKKKCYRQYESLEIFKAKVKESDSCLLGVNLYRIYLICITKYKNHTKPNFHLYGGRFDIMKIFWNPEYKEYSIIWFLSH